MKTLLTALLSLLAALCLASPGQAISDPGPSLQKQPKGVIEIEGYKPAEDLFLEKGARFTVLVKGVAATHLRAIFRPTSQVEHLQEVGTLQDGKLEWTPNRAGLARLEAYVMEKDEKGEPVPKILATRVVSVRRGPGFPLGLTIMIIAGAILFFGAFSSIRALLQA